METINITGPDFMLIPSDLSDELAEHWPITSGGDAEEHCQYILDHFNIECEEETAKALLRPYGAWEEDDLEDHHANMLRLVWLIGCDLGETGESYLSTY